MNSRELAYNTIKRRAYLKKEKRLERLEELRKDSYFDGLFCEANSLRWDCVLLTDEQKRKDCQARLAECEKKLQDYLSEKKITENVFSDTESCSLCHDTGVYENKMCPCADRVRKQIELKRSPLLSKAVDSFEKIDYTFYKERESDYRKYTKFLKRDFVDGDIDFAVLTGKTGTAKSYIACATLLEMQNNGSTVFALNSLEMNKIFLEYHCALLENKQDIWNELIEPDVLLIDDLGVEPIYNNVTVTYLYALLIDRIDKKTVLTTNLDIRELEQRYGQRVVSRLLDKRKGAVVPIVGKDLRF